MDERSVKDLLNLVKSGDISVDDALLSLKEEPFEDMGFARPDFHRGIRQGKPEVIYGAGKTPEQIQELIAERHQIIGGILGMILSLRILRMMEGSPRERERLRKPQRRNKPSYKSSKTKKL